MMFSVTLLVGVVIHLAVAFARDFPPGQLLLSLKNQNESIPGVIPDVYREEVHFINSIHPSEALCVVPMTRACREAVETSSKLSVGYRGALPTKFLAWHDPWLRNFVAVSNLHFIDPRDGLGAGAIRALPTLIRDAAPPGGPSHVCIYGPLYMATLASMAASSDVKVTLMSPGDFENAEEDEYRRAMTDYLYLQSKRRFRVAYRTFPGVLSDLREPCDVLVIHGTPRVSNSTIPLYNLREVIVGMFGVVRPGVSRMPVAIIGPPVVDWDELERDLEPFRQDGTLRLDALVPGSGNEVGMRSASDGGLLVFGLRGLRAPPRVSREAVISRQFHPATVQLWEQMERGLDRNEIANIEAVLSAIPFTTPSAREDVVGAPGYNAYYLLHWIAQRTPSKVILDIGTWQGTSAVVLAEAAPHARVVSYDIEDVIPTHHPKTHPRVDYLLYDLTALNATLPAPVEDIGLVYLDASPHDGEIETNLLLALIRLGFHGIVICDDIKYNERQGNYWSWIEYPKLDMSYVGHHSGTGAILI